MYVMRTAEIFVGWKFFQSVEWGMREWNFGKTSTVSHHKTYKFSLIIVLKFILVHSYPQWCDLNTCNYRNISSTPRQRCWWLKIFSVLHFLTYVKLCHCELLLFVNIPITLQCFASLAAFFFSKKHNLEGKM